jgi:hypothetical protein
MTRELRNVEQLPADQAVAVLGLSDNGGETTADSAGEDVIDSETD